MKSLRTRFLTTSIGASLLLGLALFYTIGYWASLRERTVRGDLKEMAGNTAGAARSFLVEVIRGGRDAAVLLADTPPEQRRRRLQSIKANHPEFAAIRYISGRTIESAPAKTGASGSQIRRLPSVVKVMAGAAQSVEFHHGRASSGTIELALEARNAEGRQGLVLVSVETGVLARALPRAVTIAQQLHLLDQRGRVILSSSPLEPAEQKRLSEEVKKHPRGSDEVFELSGEGRPREILAAISPIPELHWTAASTSDEFAFEAPIRRQQKLSIAVFLLVTVAGLLLVNSGAAAVIRSIKRLSRAAGAIAGGDFGYRLRWRLGNEMDDLIDAFNDMAKRLDAHQDLLHERNGQLNVLLSVVEGLRSEKEPTELLRLITRDAAFVTGAGMAFLALVEGDRLVLHEWWDGGRWNPVQFSWSSGAGVPGWIWSHNAIFSSSEPGSNVIEDQRLSDVFHARTYMGAPVVLHKGVVGGVLLVGSEVEVSPFTEDDERILELLARHAGVALEMAEAFQREKHVAATLQKAMLPDVETDVNGVSIAREYHAAWNETELGGDFYDVLEMNGGKVGLVIADVSGKGLRAAVQTASVKYALRAYALEDPDPASVLRRLNSACCSTFVNRGFVSLLFAVVDPGDWTMQYANAGHQRPLLRHADGTVEMLDAGGVVLGVVDSGLLGFKNSTVQLQPGDALVLYTDGLSEARSGDEFLDTEGLQELLSRLDGSAQEIAQSLLQGAVAFAEGALRDDVALLVARVPDRIV